jgi:hypothetical protein
MIVPSAPGGGTDIVARLPGSHPGRDSDLAQGGEKHANIKIDQSCATRSPRRPCRRLAMTDLSLGGAVARKQPRELRMSTPRDHRAVIGRCDSDEATSRAAHVGARDDRAVIARCDSDEATSRAAYVGAPR